MSQDPTEFRSPNRFWTRRKLLGVIGGGTVGVAVGAGVLNLYVNITEPATVSPTTKLIPTDGTEADNFGWSVAVSSDGSTAIIEAIGDEDSNGQRAGSAYVFSRENGEWSQWAKLTAGEGDEGDNFGRSVAMSADGTTAIIGSGSLHFDSVTPSYVFERTDEGWIQQAQLTADDGDSADQFGDSVAISADGTTAIIGSRGAAYVFNLGSEGWIQQAKLDSAFGLTAAISADGTTALIGSWGADTLNGDMAGSAYVFERTEGTWSQRAKLVPTDGDGNDFFGSSVAVSANGTTALVGADKDSRLFGNLGAGSAYVFERTDGTWSQRSKLGADDGDSDDYFGGSIAVSTDGTTIIVGALGDDPNGQGSGSAYVFTE